MMVDRCLGQGETQSIDMRKSSVNSFSKVDEDVPLRKVQNPQDIANADWDLLIDDIRRQSDTNCGAACLHTLLRLNRILVKKKDVYRAVSVTSQGASLAELQAVALKFGLDCEVREVSVSEFWKLRPPLIVHLKESKNHAGHYLVMHRIHDSQRADFIDSTTGVALTITEPMLYEIFSGYCLVPVRRWSLLSALESTSLAGLVVACVAFARTKIIQRRRAKA